MEQGRQVLPFFVMPELIGNENVVKAEPVEGPDQSTPDETCAAGDQDFAACQDLVWLIHNLKSRADRR